MDEPSTLARPFEIPNKPKKKYEDIGFLKKDNTIKPTNKGKFIKGKNFLLVYLSIKKPDIIRVTTDIIE